MQGKGNEGVAIIHQITSGNKEQGADEAGDGVVLCTSKSGTLHLSSNEDGMWRRRRRRGLGTRLFRDHDIIFILSLGDCHTTQQTLELLKQLQYLCASEYYVQYSLLKSLSAI